MDIASLLVSKKGLVMLFSLKIKESVKDSVEKMGRLLLSKNIARAWTHGNLASQFRKRLFVRTGYRYFWKRVS